MGGMLYTGVGKVALRKTLSLLTAGAMLTASIPSGVVFAQDRVAAASVGATVPAAPISPVVLATLKAFPNGGQALTDRIRLLILQNNDLARDVARAIKANGLLTAAQREAAEKGLAEALSRLGVFAQAVGGLSSTQWAIFLAALAAAGAVAGYEYSQVSPH